ncbi:PiggyBac transposable element-derived protein 3 [Elysia marginata]|uniref:PiggyBac transposable element-derived protein 3 n=1 Tax=Elysia marginata TaxID=1093978 RepID=A0AAV4K1U2_9GAST|nr:PiggyBac transposable element-derived protein 3 [Elysia marginata]
MSRNDSDQILKYLHHASNDNPERSKFARVTPLINLLKERFLDHFPIEQNLSIDESMCPYFGKHGAEQCIRGKPIRFGFKQWVLATPLGYIVNIIPYEGATGGVSKVNGLGYSHDRVNGIIAVEWNDNNVVTVASTKHGVQPLKTAKRWSAANKTMINIDQPHLINVYNSIMGGVDRADQNIGAYQIQIRMKKWWWPLFAFYVDASMQNAWLLYRQTSAARSQPMDQLAFKRAIVHVFLLRYKQDRVVGRPFTGRGPCTCISKRVPDEIRRDKVGHYLEAGPTQRICGLCKKNTKMVCEKCNVRVHMKCSQQFHA